LDGAPGDVSKQLAIPIPDAGFAAMLSALDAAEKAPSPSARFAMLEQSKPIFVAEANNC